MNTLHQPVLSDQVVQALSPKPGETYLDATAGYGGHTAAVLELTGKNSPPILIDRDENAIKALKQRFGDSARFINLSFLEAAKLLQEEGTKADLILLDLGLSSPQIDNAERGFSFRSDAPLDMRMDPRQKLTASDVVNNTPQGVLESIIREYGEEPYARAVARAIVDSRPISTTAGLAKVVRGSAMKSRDIDAATRTFQAIRIKVNQELEQLAGALPILTDLLSPGGRIAVISFHSLEDRIVKQFFDQESRDCICPPKQPVCTCDHVATLKKLTSKPVAGDQNEIAINPRARSAKLRAAEKINKNKRRD